MPEAVAQLIVMRYKQVTFIDTGCLQLFKVPFDSIRPMPLPLYSGNTAVWYTYLSCNHSPHRDVPTILSPSLKQKLRPGCSRGNPVSGFGISFTDAHTGVFFHSSIISA
jgi:hypothetical protein